MASRATGTLVKGATGLIGRAYDLVRGGQRAAPELIHKLSGAERRVVDDLRAMGRSVDLVPRSGASQTPDFLVDGVRTELKTLTQWGDTSLKNAIQKASKQGDRILIDARNVNATELSIIQQINRAEGNIGGLAGRVEVWWSGGVIWR